MLTEITFASSIINSLFTCICLIKGNNVMGMMNHDTGNVAQ